MLATYYNPSTKAIKYKVVVTVQYLYLILNRYRSPLIYEGLAAAAAAELDQ